MRYYSDTCPPSTLSVGIAPSDTNIVLTIPVHTEFAGYPFVLRIDPGTGDEELVLVASGLGTGGSPYVVTRGWGSTTAKTHLANAPVRHGVGSDDLQESRNHEADGLGDAPHGLPDAAWRKARSTYNIADYGAVSGGSSATNAAALAAAVAAFIAGGGGEVYVPAGTYDIGTYTIDLDNIDNFRIRGAGMWASNIQCQDRFLDAINDSDQGSVSDLYIQNTLSGNTFDGIVVDTPRRWVIENCYIRGFGGSSIWFRGGLHSRVQGNYIGARDPSAANGYAGIHFDQSSTGVVGTTHTSIRNYVGSGVQFGIRWYRTTNSMTIGDIIELVSGVGLRIDLSSVTVVELYTEAITGNAFEQHDSIGCIIGRVRTEPVVTWSATASADRRIARLDRNTVGAGRAVVFGGTSGLIDPTLYPSIRSGTGTPETAQTGVVGSLWMRSDGGASSSLYVKSSGTGNTGWYPVTGVLDGSASLDFPSIAAGATAELTITVTGAATGDVVHVGPPASLNAGLMHSARVSAADTVTIRLHNTTGSAIDPAAATWKVRVGK